ncbi:MAG: hypothetical protein DMG17_17505 [Acidobacteria bacterium]|nr:MAG: hypothetical protein DMG17_17505 [Acidobacteriota bacterium]
MNSCFDLGSNTGRCENLNGRAFQLKLLQEIGIEMREWRDCFPSEELVPDHLIRAFGVQGRGVHNLSNVECLLVRQAKSGPSRKLKGVYR